MTAAPKRIALRETFKQSGIPHFDVVPRNDALRYVVRDLAVAQKPTHAAFCVHTHKALAVAHQFESDSFVERFHDSDSFVFVERFHDFESDNFVD
jgi:hypothetical protein